MSQSAPSEPGPALIASCENALQEAMDATDGIIFGMTATVDGLEVASVSAPGWDIPANRLAAMASSGHALGDTVAAEMTDTDCQNVIIDADRVSIVFISVAGIDDPPLLLGMAATKSASLGNVLVGARECAARIRESVAEAA